MYTCDWIRQTSRWAVGIALMASPLASMVSGQIVTQLTDGKHELVSFGESMDHAGTKVWVITNGNSFGTNPSREFRIVEYNAATGAGVQRTSFAVGGPALYYNGSLAASDDGQSLAFISRSNPTGQNADRSYELF